MNEDWEVGARRTEETLKRTAVNKNWRQRLAGTAAGAALLAAAGLGINKTIDANTNTPDFGKPLSDHSLIVELQNIRNTGGENIKPTFREDPKSASKELTEEELEARGINLLDNNIKVREVRGATYPGNPIAGDYGSVHDEKNKIDYGIWGEVVLTDPNTGEEKPTGVFLSKNFYTEFEQPQSPENSAE